MPLFLTAEQIASFESKGEMIVDDRLGAAMVEAVRADGAVPVHSLTPRASCNNTFDLARGRFDNRSTVTGARAGRGHFTAFTACARTRPDTGQRDRTVHQDARIDARAPLAPKDHIPTHC
ncbi:hypothetical protein ACN2XU_06190 [Primorskyibacter sp. 2E107]|uniref:hypothetical protein n=1 Tax=Primorskyibacter sp. 2E107 TaxID=3403458 RepID=UPI003AF9A195